MNEELRIEHLIIPEKFSAADVADSCVQRLIRLGDPKALTSYGRANTAEVENPERFAGREHRTRAAIQKPRPSLGPRPKPLAPAEARLREITSQLRSVPSADLFTHLVLRAQLG